MANEPVNIFGEWSVFTTFQEGRTLCYAMTIPNNSKTNIENRGRPFVTVIKEKNSDKAEFNVSVGYMINDEIGSIEVQIKNNKYPLINFKDMAWTYSSEDDSNIIDDFIASAIFTVYSKSKNNEYSIDIYSLNGFSKAYKNILKLCK